MIHVFMRHFKPYFLLLLIVLCVICPSGCSKAGNAKEAQTSFDDFIDAVFTEEVQCDSLTINYTLTKPEAYGITDFEPTFGELSLNDLKKNIAASENYISRLNSYHYKQLTESQKLTYDILKAYLTPDKEAEKYYLYNEYLESTIGIQAQLPILLAEYNFVSKSDFEHYLALLPDIQNYFGDIEEFEKEKSKAGLFMTDSSANAIIEQCKNFVEKPSENYLITIFNSRVDSFEGLTPQEKAQYKAENEKAILNYVVPAYQSLIDTLTDLLGTGKTEGGLSNLPNGKDFYEYIVAGGTGSSKSIKQIDSALDSAINVSLMEMSSLAIKNPEIYDKVTDVTYPMTDPEEIITYLKTAIQEEFPPLENVNCTIKYVPKSLEDYLSPAFYLTPPIDSFTENNVYINGGKDYDLSSIFTTIAHEGYPGHLYQNVYFRQTNAPPLRNLLSFGGYAEGWATYVELYSYSLSGLDKNAAEFLKNNCLMTLCIYGKMDVGIHYYGWDKEKTAEYLKDFGITDDATVISVYNTIVSQPGNYLKYVLGALEFQELRQTAEKALGNKFSPVDFHTFILETGPCQFSILKDRLQVFIKTQK